MITYLLHFCSSLRRGLRCRHHLVLENLALPQQLAVLWNIETELGQAREVVLERPAATVDGSS